MGGSASGAGGSKPVTIRTPRHAGYWTTEVIQIWGPVKGVPLTHTFNSEPSPRTRCARDRIGSATAVCCTIEQSNSRPAMCVLRRSDVRISAFNVSRPVQEQNITGSLNSTQLVIRRYAIRNAAKIEPIYNIITFYLLACNGTVHSNVTLSLYGTADYMITAVQFAETCSSVVRIRTQDS
jgi:hypothetical protein